METTEIRPGLWRWTAPHPSWTPKNDTPTGWGQMVGCVYYEPGRGPAGSEKDREPGIVLFDPLAPPEGTADAERFWRVLDGDISRLGRPVTILIGNEYHGRSARTIEERHRDRPGVRIWTRAGDLTALSVRSADLPPQVEIHQIGCLSEGEVAFFIREHGTLIIADALSGVGGGKLRIVPASWAPDTPDGQAGYQRDFRPAIRRLLDLPIEMVLVSHGAPVLENGRRALEDALASPAMGG